MCIACEHLKRKKILNIIKAKPRNETSSKIPCRLRSMFSTLEISVNEMSAEALDQDSDNDSRKNGFQREDYSNQQLALPKDRNKHQTRVQCPLLTTPAAGYMLGDKEESAD